MLRSLSHWTFIFACGALLASMPLLSAEAQESKVTFKEKDGGLAVMVGTEQFTFLHNGPEWAKPFLAPVHAPGGATVTRMIGDPEDKDHPHHKGIWFSVDEVSKVDAKVKSKHWVEKDPIINENVEILVAEGNPAKLKITNTWKTRDGEPLVAETSVVSIFGNRVMIYDATLTALKDPIEFGDTKEGMFAFRFIDDLREVPSSSEWVSFDRLECDNFPNSVFVKLKQFFEEG